MFALSLLEIATEHGWPRGARFVMIAPQSGKQPSSRQTAVVQALADGMTMREAAEALAIAHETARTHAESFRHRAHAHSMNHAIAIGFRQGWLT